MSHVYHKTSKCSNDRYNGEGFVTQFTIGVLTYPACVSHGLNSASLYDSARDLLFIWDLEAMLSASQHLHFHRLSGRLALWLNSKSHDVLLPLPKASQRSEGI